MIFHRLNLVKRRQSGFTLIETIIALTIAVIVVTAVTITAFQVINGSARSNNHMTAVREVQNAGYWVSRDVQMAQIVTLGASSGFPLTLEWTEQFIGNVTHTITYTLVDGELRRIYSENNGESTEATVAEFICSCKFEGFTFTVTATVGEGLQVGTETREYSIIPRPN